MTATGLLQIASCEITPLRYRLSRPTGGSGLTEIHVLLASLHSKCGAQGTRCTGGRTCNMHGRLARVHIDGQRVGFATGSRATEQIELTGDINRLPLSVRGAHIRTFIVTIEIRCERTNRAVEEWRLATYSAILEAYQEKRREYEEKLAALQMQAGVAISGRNPEANRVLERDELKKSCISLLTRRNFLKFMDQRFPEYAVAGEDVFPNGPWIVFNHAAMSSGFAWCATCRSAQRARSANIASIPP